MWPYLDLFDAVHAGNKEHVDKILNTREDWRDVQNEVRSDDLSS